MTEKLVNDNGGMVPGMQKVIGGICFAANPAGHGATVSILQFPTIL
jgi:hypothetical protein